MAWEWYNLYVCPQCGSEVAEAYKKTYNREQYSVYRCFSKKCRWIGRNPGEIHSRVYE